MPIQLYLIKMYIYMFLIDLSALKFETGLDISFRFIKLSYYGISTVIHLCQLIAVNIFLDN